MSAVLEQTVEEVSHLKGATILDVRVEDDGFGDQFLALDLRLKDEVADGTSGQTGKYATIQVWQDVEGNGPGYLALTDIREEKR